MARRRPLFAVLALVPLLTGCGHSYGKADFIARADAICAVAVRDTRAVSPPVAQQPSALGRYAARVLQVVRREEVQLRMLPVPPEPAAQTRRLERYLAANEAAVHDYGALAAAADRGDTAGIANAEAALRATPVSALAGRYGLRACAAPGATVR